jgi:hypothetical protein
MSVQKAVEEVVRFLRGLDFRRSSDSPGSDFSLWISDKDIGSVAISGKEYFEFKRCLNLLEKAFEKEPKFSREGLEWILKQTVLRAAGVDSFTGALTQEQIRRARSWMEDRLAVTSLRFLVYIPVQGFDPVALPGSFGKVDFLPNTPSERAKLKTLMVDLYKTCPTGETSDVEEWIDVVDEHFVSSAIARIGVSAGDDHNAVDKANSECRQTLDVLNFFFRQVLYGMGEYAVSIAGEGYECFSHRSDESRSTPRFVAGIARDHEDGVEFEGSRVCGTRLDLQKSGPLMALNLPKMTMDNCKWPSERGMVRAAGMLAKNSGERTKWEDRILAAIQWAGRATSCIRREDAFLMYMIALESFLMGDGKTEISYQLRVRASHVIKKDLKSRKELMRTMAEIYNTRSRIVHSGKYDVTRGQLEEVSRCTTQAILYALVAEPFSEMTDPKQFEEWLNDQILYGPGDNM